MFKKKVKKSRGHKIAEGRFRFGMERMKKVD